MNAAARGFLLTLSLVLPAAAAPPTAQGQDAQTPGPPQGIAGLAGFTSVSRVVFPGEGVPPHRFEAVYLFPDRARWRLLAVGGRSSERLLVYRLGGSAYQLAPGQSRSTEFESGSLAQTLMQMELRRAAMLWPHGFDWTGTGSERRAPVLAPVQGGQDGQDGQGGEEPGWLVATLGEDGRPDRIQARTAHGVKVESFLIDTWQDLRGRAWPHTLRLTRGEETLWTETVESVQTKVYFVDLFFQPPDRRPAPPTALAGGQSLLSLDLQGITIRTQDLEPEVDWSTALAAARAAIERASEEEGLEVDAVPAFDLDERGHPRRLLLRLAERDDTPAEGWTTLPDRPGLALVLDDLGQLDAGVLQALADAAPPGSRPGTPYCRVLARPSGRQIQVYLPLEGP